MSTSFLGLRICSCVKEDNSNTAEVTICNGRMHKRFIIFYGEEGFITELEPRILSPIACNCMKERNAQNETRLLALNATQMQRVLQLCQKHMLNAV